MTKKEMLARIRDLETIVALQGLLLRKPKDLSWNEFVSGVSSTIRCEHDWNYAWGATTPPPCKKCGKLAPEYKVTCGSGEAKF